VSYAQTFDRIVALPPEGVISRIDPKVGEMVARSHGYESTLPIHADGEQRNQREDLRNTALAALVDAEFFEKLSEQREERRARMRENLSQLQTDWLAEEADAGLERWRNTRANYAPVMAGGLSVSTGNGNREQISGRRMIGTLLEMIEG